MAEARGRRRHEAALAAIEATEIFLTQVNLRLDLREPVPRPLPPTQPNTWTIAEGREWLWLGPDEWLVVSHPDSREPRRVIEELEAGLAGSHHSAVDVSAGRTVIELSGARRFDLLEQGCGLDLHPRSWRDGMCAQTLLAHIQVILQEREAATRIFVRPSFAGYLVDWLLAVS